MDISKAESEQVYKSWDYAKTKGLIFTKGLYNLTVTDKKVITVTKTKLNTTRTEIMKNEISGVSVSNGKGSLLPAIFLLLRGLIVTICSVMFIPLLAIGLPLMILGIIAIICRRASISVTLYIKSHAEEFLSANSIKSRRRAKRLRVKIDRNAADEIANELSSYLLTR